MSRPRRTARSGFTLVELVATMTLVATLGSVVCIIVSSSVGGYTRAATTAQLNSEVGVALDRIDQLWRFIPLSASGGPDIASLTPTSMTWSANWTLMLNGTNLTLSEAGGAASVLLKDVSAFSVAACDESNAPLAASLSGSACDNIRRLRVSITQTRSGIAETLRTTVFVRSQMAGVGD